MTDMTKRIVVVLGMHRSGTSAITRGLQVLSLDLGNKLISGLPGNNEKGFWEDAEINAFNEALLKKLDSAWHRLAKLDDQALLRPEFSLERKAAATLLQGKLPDNAVFAFKDPRTSILLPFWQNIFTQLGLSPSYLITIRNPLDVAESLHKRDGFAQVKGLMLWAKYVVGALRETQQQQRVFVTYDAMLEAPAEQLARIADALELPPPEAAPQALREFTEEFLTPALRHNVAALDRLGDRLQVSPFVHELYQLLQQLAADKLPANGKAFEQRWQAFEQRYIEFLPLLAHSDMLEIVRDQASRERENAMQQLAVAINARDQALTAQQVQAAAHDQLIAELSNQRVQLEVTTFERENALQQLALMVHERDQALSSQQAQTVSHDQVLDELTKLRILLEELHVQHRAAEQALSKLTQEQADTSIAYQHSLSEKADLADQLSSAQQAVQAAQTSIHSLTEVQTLLQQEHQTAQMEAARLTETIHKLERLRTQDSQESQLLREQVSSAQARLETLAQVQQHLQEEKAELIASRDQLRQQLKQLQNQCTAEQQNALHLSQQLAQTNAQLARILSSKSWVLTKPLRFLRRSLMTRPYWLIRRLLSNGAHATWHSLPFPVDAKQRFKNALFKGLPFVFRRTQAYRSWQNFTAPISHNLPTPSSAIAPPSPLLAPASAEYIPLLQGAPLKNKPVKLICFYLPQFHPIAENDAWWGEGFTEWTNVRPAQPQFAGHYQPHVPGELGYYSLLDPAVQRRQTELAKLYGIEGFCFYFYWFGGKRLLETPIENYLKDPSLDLPFCLCWANENWSRRWDGLDSEILIAQQHSPEDDLAFIAHVAQYMRDARYIRIDGKPLLLVYRPSLLPSAKETAERWRTWCRTNGIGEIYLAYTQSFEAVDPGKYGFDAAIEFPPNNSAPPNITEQVEPLKDDFACNVYDWRIFVERSRDYKKPGYTLFRGVCPAWDNTARRKNRSSVLLNSSPLGYQQWLYNAIDDTCERFSNPDQRLIFINAWNEWAEGAHLEPDQRYGYAYLEATRMALVRKTLATSVCEPDLKRPVAIVIHAFYEDVFDEILDYIEKIRSIPLKLYVTTTHEQQESIEKKLSQQRHEFTLLPVINRGRDVLPFIKIMPEILNGGHDFLIKIHTKKSTHRQDGDKWRRDLYEKLLTEHAILNSIAHFQSKPEIGILGPTGHIVPMSYYWGSNASRVESLATRMGIPSDSLSALNFVAGTMFMARCKALIPIANLALSENDFEPETGQVDGTLAHAIERSLTVSASATSLDVCCQNNIVVETYSHAKRILT
ncbi:MAG: glycoside hydrolase family 99-like domain-containing protein [Pseudomonas sp.]|uniref:glycoside hydrolase family 99-like domain-containing protein n=1 Tax=Pseudomonas sp. TaxID=306 RepID=UPI00299DF4C8|nr:glycoside hydrolase family 99-like domain-containing protein [Pseudomonas sp.]MDX1722555.1 glycoside hydrolase family 99-like domain-containing protein [Pseudomonas sp.]